MPEVPLIQHRCKSYADQELNPEQPPARVILTPAKTAPLRVPHKKNSSCTLDTMYALRQGKGHRVISYEFNH